MVSYNPVVQLKAELRPCKVKGKNAFFHKWSDVSSIIPPSAMVGGHTGGTVSRTIGIIEYIESGVVHECFPTEIIFLDTKEKATGFCWDDRTADDYKTALVIGKTQHDAENMVKNLGLVGFKTILTRGEENINNLEGIKADRVYIYDDCTNRAKCFAQTFVQNVIYGAVWVIKRDKESEQA